MDSLFIIPTLISPEVDDKIVPSVCKLVERSILLQNASLFRKAAIQRFLARGKGLNTESEKIFERLEMLVKLTEADEDDEKKKKKTAPPDRSQRIRNYNKPGTANSPEKYDPKPVYGDKEKVEVPKGISFYSAVSLEPTYIEIPLQGRSSGAAGDEVTRIVRIGMKSVPFKLDGIKYLKDYLYFSKNRAVSSVKFHKTLSRLKRYIFGWDADYRKKPFELFKVAPTTKELSNVNFIKKRLGTNVIALWSPLTVFSHYDFRDAELKENLWTYNQFVRGGWGNMVIIDDDSQLVYFCMPEMRACHQLTFTYLKKVLDMEDVINVSGTVSRSARPMSSNTVGTASIFSNFSSVKKENKKEDSIRNTLNEISEVIRSVSDG